MTTPILNYSTKEKKTNIDKEVEEGTNKKDEDNYCERH